MEGRFLRIKIRPLFLVMGLLLGATGIQAAGQSEPAAKGPSLYSAPVPKREYLLNGLQLILLERPDSDRIRVHLRINSGALFDLTDRGGLAEITSAMILRGGSGLSSKSVAETIAQLELQVGVTAGWDSIDLVMAGPDDSLDPLIDLLSKLVIRPTFDPKELQDLKTIRIAKIKASAANDADLVSRKAAAAMFGSHPFGKQVHGTVESIPQIAPADLSYYHSRFFVANNAQLFVSGKLSMERLLALAKSRFGIWKKGDKVPATFKAPEVATARRILLVDRPGLSRATIAVGKIGFSRRAEDYYASAVMIEMLRETLPKKMSSEGGGDISLQLSFQPLFLSSPLLFEIQCANDSAAAAVERLIAELTRFRTGQFSSQQVEDAKQAIVARFGQRVANSETAEEMLLDIETYGLGRDYIIRFAEWIAAVTPGEVKNASQKYLDVDSLTVVVAAPIDRVEPALKRVGATAPVK